jgi:hypothetical protein
MSVATATASTKSSNAPAGKFRQLQFNDQSLTPPHSKAAHFLGGLGSGIFSAVLLQPADLLKTRRQQSGNKPLLTIIREIAAGPTPVRGFWRGTVPSALRTGFGSALYFGGLNSLREYVLRSRVLAPLTAPAGTSTAYSTSSLPKLSNFANLATGAVTRASVGLLVMPITILKVRYESSVYSYKSLIGAARDIFQVNGIRGFFSGYGATAIRDAPYAGLYVLFYEQLKKRLAALALTQAQEREAALLNTQITAQLNTIPQNGLISTNPLTSPVVTLSSSPSASKSASINFLSGVIAAGLATAATNPFDSVKTRMQIFPSEYRYLVPAVRKMIAKDGWRSLFDGLGLRVARKGASSALAWTIYEDLIRRLKQRAS